MDSTTQTRAIFGTIAGALLIAQATVLHIFGQPAFAASGHFMLWVGDPYSPDTSQQFADWYSFSHLIHGFIFYGLLHLFAPRLPFAARLCIAMGIEIAWEITENTPTVIAHYRQQALAVGYKGDSIFNSVMDTATMATGFFIASRLDWRIVLAVALTLEIFTAIIIRDNLTLNVINLIAPSDWTPIKAIHAWQAGAIHH